MIHFIHIISWKLLKGLYSSVYYRDLPIGIIDLGVRLSNEMHEALAGLTRVCIFKQDKIYIFYWMDQIQDEIKNHLDFQCYIYWLFQLNLSLFKYLYRKLLETNVVSANAEYQVKQVGWDLKKLEKGDIVFYRSKIDLQLYDTYKREHWHGTIQLTERNNLQYRANEDIK